MALSTETKKEIIDLFHKFANIFAWSYQDMLRLSTEIVEYHLPLKPKCKPIQQKLRRMKPEIKEEVKKQFDVGFLEVAKYPEWVANIVHVLKKDKKVGMCVLSRFKSSKPKR